MESLLLLHPSCGFATYLPLTLPKPITNNQNAFLNFPRRTKSVILRAKKKKNSNNNNNDEDIDDYLFKPEERLFFPEAVLLKEKKVQEDGRLLPEFADAEEENLYEFLNIQLQSELKVDQMRHYEVVYLIHEKHAEEVESVNEKVQDFLREKKGKIWRVNDWGLRRLAYKIQKAKNAHYILMNFELEAKWINDFKSMLDKDERVIRHLVIKRDEAITKDCPPPPEFHTLRAEMSGYDDEEEDIDDEDFDDEAYDDEDFDDEGEDDGDVEDGFIVVNVDEEEEEKASKSASVSTKGRRNLKAEKVPR
ncbi:hypothetical protein Dsin_027570 [Dipteronia sinensis]|uniref:Ribosomal protein S6 n=1 Tax=Dipteronia sinensis TaxID=43782 RepID=A0AAD9ZPG4_9ROSI|nr:hypothetical protein Dsin_027570 [Dipteronia sinensis]